MFLFTCSIMKATSLFVPLLTAAFVSAHGFLHTVTINGKAYTGNAPQAKQVPSIIRQISSQNPNKGAMNPALTCGPNASPAALVANANPGDSLTFDWKAQDLSHWPHDTGPMLTYMGACSGPCNEDDASNIKWFKINEQLRDNNNGKWAQASLMTGGVGSATIPNNLAPGNYLLRHEIIALHLATAMNGAEFYPGCAQLKVGGSQTGVPRASDLVSLPGAYSDSNPGIFDPTVYNPNSKYIPPGPEIATLVSSNGAPSSGNSNGAPSSGKSNGAPSNGNSNLAPPSANSGTTTTTGTKPTTTKSCKAKRASDVRKRRLTRALQKRSRYRSNAINSPSRK